jgi:hypothetical protein
LHNILSIDLSKAVSSLTETVRSLDAYSEVQPRAADVIPANPAAQVPGATATPSDSDATKGGGNP